MSHERHCAGRYVWLVNEAEAGNVDFNIRQSRPMYLVQRMFDEFHRYGLIKVSTTATAVKLALQSCCRCHSRS